jgi:phosphoribosylformylglycinamidine cyclo-ligase
MNVNDLVCVGAEPLAMVDYLAVERADPTTLREIGVGLRRGAELAGVEIPGGELAQLPDMIRGHPSPHGLDLVGAAIGTVPLGDVVTGTAIEPGDVVIGLPSSGLHSNGFTLARAALFERGGWSLDDVPSELGRSLADELLEPTEIYVRAILELLGSGAQVNGLAHITGDGLLNLRRLNDEVGYEISAPLPSRPIFGLIQAAAGISAAEMHQVFNMGTGFCCVVASQTAGEALTVLHRHYPAASEIGVVTDEAGMVRVPSAGIAAAGDGFEPI